MDNCYEIEVNNVRKNITVIEERASHFMSKHKTSRISDLLHSGRYS